MRKLIFSGFGCEIFNENEKFYICYDSGESAGSKLAENEITEEEAIRAQGSEQSAYRVILAAQERLKK